MNIASNIEHWALIDGYDNYEISSFGRVRNNKTNRILAQQISKGYFSIKLCKNGTKPRFSIHRLVATVFCVKENNEFDMVDHIDRNTQNNIYTNLRWCNSSINNKNSTISSRNKSGQKGVCIKGKYWYAFWMENKIRKYKYFLEKQDAIKCRLEMEQLHGYV